MTIYTILEFDISLNNPINTQRYFRVPLFDKSDNELVVSNIDWGDGSTNNILLHNYSSLGKYSVKVYIDSRYDYSSLLPIKLGSALPWGGKPDDELYINKWNDTHLDTILPSY